MIFTDRAKSRKVKAESYNFNSIIQKFDNSITNLHGKVTHKRNHTTCKIDIR